ncbi:MAG: hypothetical protein AAB917_01150 [Patescibacteria group bacterium]
MVYVELQSLNNSAEGPITKRDLFEFGEVLRRDLRKDLQQDIDEKLDDFAVIVNNSFIAQREYMDERFNHVDTRLDGIDIRLNVIDGRLDAIDTRLDDVDIHLKDIDISIRGLDSRILGTNNRIDDLATNYTRRDEHGKLEKRVGKLELKSA